MTHDRYMKAVFTVIAVALVMIAARMWLPAVDLVASLRPGSAEAQAVPPTPKYDINVPMSWGKLVGWTNNNMILESSEGFRIVDPDGKSPEYPKVKVLIRRP